MTVSTTQVQNLTANWLGLYQLVSYIAKVLQTASSQQLNTYPKKILEGLWFTLSGRFGRKETKGSSQTSKEFPSSHEQIPRSKKTWNYEGSCYCSSVVRHIAAAFLLAQLTYCHFDYSSQPVLLLCCSGLAVCFTSKICSGF